MKRLTFSFILFTFFVLLIIGAQGLFAQPANLTPTPGASVVMVGGSVSLQWVAGGGPPFTLTYTIDGAPQVPIVIGPSPTISPFPIFPAPGGLVVGNVVSWTITDGSGISPATTFTVISAPTPTPANAATGVSQALASVSWTAFDEGGFGDGNYDVDFDDAPAFGSIDAFLANTALTSLGLPALAYNTPYYWRVRDTDIDGLGGDGPWYTFSFTTEIATPVLTGPADASTGQAIPVSLTWTLAGGSGGVTFDLQYHTGGGFPGTTVPGVSSPYSFDGLLNGTTYTWRIVAKKGGEADKTSASRTFKTILATPTLGNPVIGLTGISVLPTFTWTDVTGETGYTLKISTAGSGANQATFDAGLIVSKAVAANATTYSFLATDDTDLPLTNGTVYTWQLFANDVVTGPYSGVNSLIRHFTVAPGFTVSQNSPTDLQSIQSTTVNFGWSIGQSSSGLTFEVQYKIMSVAPTAESDWSGATSLTTTNLSVSNSVALTLGKTYRWRVLIKRTSGGDYVHYPAPNVFRSFSTEGGTTVTLTPNWPTGGTIVYTNTPRLDWIVTGFTTGLTYEVGYRRATGYGAPAPGALMAGATTITGLTTLYTTLPTLLPGETYYWQIRAEYSGTYTSWTTPTTFVVNGPGTLEIPTVNYPRDGATIYSNTPRLDWTLTTSGTGLTYQICYVKDETNPGGAVAGGADVNGSTGKLTSGTTSPDLPPSNFSSNKYLTSPTLEPGKTYWWQVRAYSATKQSILADVNYVGAFSNWSTPTSFVNSGPGTLVVPTLNYPTGGITIYTTAPTLTWYLTTYSTGLYYEIEYDLAANGFGGTADVHTTTADVFSLQLTGLTPGASYHYQIRSKNVPGLNPGASYRSGWSSEGTFTVAGGTVASYAVANWPIGGTTVYTNPPTLSWYLEGSTLGITGYTVKYNRGSEPANWITFDGSDNDATEGQYTGLSASTFSKLITAELTYGATYYWAVYATGTLHPVNAAGVGSFTVVGGSGSTTVVNSYPYNASTVYSTTVPFSWYISGSTAGIVSYTLMYSPSDTWGVADVTVTNITSIPKTITGLTNGTTYYWKVKAVYADASATAFSDTWSFTIQQGSSIIVQPWIGGPHNVAINTNSPTFSWVLPVPPATGLKYELEYSTSSSFLNSTKIENVPNQYATVSGLSSNTKYYWRVRSKATDGTYSYYSNLGKFDVNLPTGVEDPNTIPDEFSLKQNYPNPFNPSTKISFDLPEAARVTIKVFNTIGQLVATVASNELLNAGSYERTFDASGLPTGIYIYQLNSDKFNAYKKMLMIK